MGVAELAPMPSRIVLTLWAGLAGGVALETYAWLNSPGVSQESAWWLSGGCLLVNIVLAAVLLRFDRQGGHW